MTNPYVGQLVVYAPDNLHSELGKNNLYATVIMVHNDHLVDIKIRNTVCELRRIEYGEKAFGCCWVPDEH